MEKYIESQILEAIKEVLDFNDPKTIRASIILARIRTILGLKDLASAPDLYEACKEAQLVINSLHNAHQIHRQPVSEQLGKALAKARGK